MHTTEKTKEEEKTPSKQTETRNSKSTISGDATYTPKKYSRTTPFKENSAQTPSSPGLTIKDRS
jgi:hypothetical protein